MAPAPAIDYVIILNNNGTGCVVDAANTTISAYMEVVDYLAGNLLYCARCVGRTATPSLAHHAPTAAAGAACSPARAAPAGDTRCPFVPASNAPRRTTLMHPCMVRGGAAARLLAATPPHSPETHLLPPDAQAGRQHGGLRVEADGTARGHAVRHAGELFAGSGGGPRKGRGCVSAWVQALPLHAPQPPWRWRGAPAASAYYARPWHSQNPSEGCAV